MRVYRANIAVLLGVVATLSTTSIIDQGKSADALVLSSKIIPTVKNMAMVEPKKIIAHPSFEQNELAGGLLPSQTSNTDVKPQPVSLDIKSIVVAKSQPDQSTQTSQSDFENKIRPSEKHKPTDKQASLNIDKIKPVQPRISIPKIKPPVGNIAGTAEIRFDDARRIKLWGDIYHNLLAQTNELKHCVNYTSTCNDPYLKNWANEIRGFKNLPKREQIQQVNNLVNQRGFQRDSVSYSQVEYWATPNEFLQARGDCEDYAILKLSSLMALGHSNNDIRLVVGKITGLGGHAFLSVKLQNTEYLLDNRTNMLSKAASRTDFKPSHSMNFAHRWVHIPKSGEIRSI